MSAPLSPRQSAVLVLLAEGLPTRHIGPRLGLSYSAARGQIYRLYAQCGVHSRAEFAAMVARGDIPASRATTTAARHDANLLATCLTLLGGLDSAGLGAASGAEIVAARAGLGRAKQACERIARETDG